DDIETKRLEDGRQVFELVCEMAKRSETLEGEVGFVVGLTNAEPEIIGKIPDSPLLLPGLGAQGGDLSLLSGSGRSAPLVINVSRGVMFGEGSSSDRALYYRDQIAEALGK
ncbi:MAG: orotidine-5'-phosphate decarboxylase, partial [Verrucomicrobiales bacterium]|nr:orotidine-5'-phosphate decarboxylase [Verrucomicrobiales bacterium]